MCCSPRDSQNSPRTAPVRRCMRYESSGDAVARAPCRVSRRRAELGRPGVSWTRRPAKPLGRAGPCTTVAAAGFHPLIGVHGREAENRGHPGNRGSPGPPPGRQLQLASAHNRCSEHRARVLGRASRRPSESNEPGTSVPPDCREPDLTLTEEDVTQTPSGCDDERHPATGRAA